MIVVGPQRDAGLPPAGDTSIRTPPTDDPNAAPSGAGADRRRPGRAAPARRRPTRWPLTALADAPVQYMNAIAPNDLAAGQPDAYPSGPSGTTPELARHGRCRCSFGSVAAVRRLEARPETGRSARRSNRSPRRSPVAVATPFLTRPLAATWDHGRVVVAGLLTTIAMLPLADGLWERIRGTSERRSIGLAIAFCEILAIFVTFAIAQQAPSWTTELIALGARLGAIPLLPGLAAAGPLDFDALRSPSASSGRLLESAEFAVAGATPLFAIALAPDAALFPAARLDRLRRRRRHGSRSGRSPGSRAGPSSSATSSSRPRKPSGRASPPTSTTTRSRS